VYGVPSSLTRNVKVVPSRNGSLTRAALQVKQFTVEARVTAGLSAREQRELACRRVYGTP